MTKRNVIKMFERVLLGIFLLITPNLISGCGGAPANNGGGTINPCSVEGYSGPVEIAAAWPPTGTTVTKNVVRDNVVCQFSIQNNGTKPLALRQVGFLNLGRTSTVLNYEAYLSYEDSNSRIGTPSSQTKFNSDFNNSTPTIEGKMKAFLELRFYGGIAKRDDSWSCRITQFDLVFSLALKCGGNGSDIMYPNISSVETGTLIKD